MYSPGNISRSDRTVPQNVINHPFVLRKPGIVGAGRIDSSGLFVADEVLAKHDENYMPPEVADALKTAHEAGKAGNPATN